MYVLSSCVAKNEAKEDAKPTEEELIDMYVNDIAGEYKLERYYYTYSKAEDSGLWGYDSYFIYIVTYKGEEYKFICYRKNFYSYKWQDIETKRIGEE